ncbi:MAG: type II secretion system F family protein [Deltaproteobacteria bacterium]
MPQFHYRAKKGPEEIVEGVIEAPGVDAAIERINQMGCLPIEVKEGGSPAAGQEGAAGAQAARATHRRVRGRDVTVMSRQLATLLKSGVPILQALTIISRQSDSAGLRMILGEISRDVKEGKAFSASLTAWPKVFSPFYIAMVRSGEDSGTLQEVLFRIARYRLKQEEMIGRLRAALAYPLLMAVVGAGTLVFMFTYVLPKLVGVFEQIGQDLPWATRMVLAFSDFVRVNGLYLLAGIVVFVFLAARSGATRGGRVLLGALSLRLPLLRTFLLYNDLARFCRTLEILIRSGIPILRALSVSVPVVSNEVLKAELGRCARDLEQGTSFGVSLRSVRHLPPFLVSLVSVGEESGKLDEALLEVAETYEQECDEAMRVLASLLEPAMILVMGLIVGFIVVAMLLPIFQMNVMAQ